MNRTDRPARCAAVHDLSGLGRCSLSVILPAMSVMGVQVCPLPTAVLSTHTGGFGTPARRDLTDYLTEALAHYRTLGLPMECVYTGYLGSVAQVALCQGLFAEWPAAMKVVDPVMGDHGKLYHGFTPELVQGIRELATHADVITPNLTEAALLLGEERNLLKFTEQTAGELADSARSMWGDFTLPATPESARTAHGQPSPPAYARTDSYTPGFPLQFPLPGQSRKTSGYGWRTDPMGGLGDDFHIGNDLAAAQGTPVLAAADGVVRMAGSHKSYGNYLRILHADGDETLYAHMQYLFVKAGECVTAGQSLGTVGETGNATGPHLHFELLHAGVRYDPTRALAKAGLQAEP